MGKLSYISNFIYFIIPDFTAARIRVKKRTRHHTKPFSAMANTRCLLLLHGKAKVLRDTERDQNLNNKLIFPQIVMVTVRNSERICKCFTALPKATE